MPVTSKTKSFTALSADTSLSPSEAIDAVRRTASQIRGEHGVGKVEGKWSKGTNRVIVEADSETQLTLKIAMDQSQRGNLRFDAFTEGVDGDRTKLQVGGLSHYQVIQSKVLGLIPTGPVVIVHFGFYKKFLDEVREDILKQDPGAKVEIGVHEEPVLSEPPT